MTPDDVEQLRADLQRSRRRRRKLRREKELLQRRFDRAETELTSLAAGQSEPDTDGLRYVFVVTYGRSGSTLLQGILSSTPGWLIRGENGDAMRPLYEFHRAASQARDRNLQTQSKDATAAWYGMDDFPTTTSIRQIRSLALATILRPEPDTRVTGFKEIRWGAYDDLFGYACFLREVFPEARFVVNTRDLENVARSKWWAHCEDAMAKLAEREKRILELHHQFGESSYHVHYDDYVADPSVLTGLFDWLGETYDEQRVRDVLARPHSY